MGSFRFFLHTPDSALYPNKLTNKLQKNSFKFHSDSVKNKSARAKKN